MHRQLAQARHAERLPPAPRARAARSRARRARGRCRAVQRFQGGVKNGSTRSPSSSRSRAAAGRDVRALRRGAARRAELALAPLELVVGVRVARAGAGRRAAAPASRPRAGRQLRRDDREVERQRRARRSGRSARTGARRPSRRRRRGRRPRPARRRARLTVAAKVMKVTLPQERDVRCGGLVTSDCERVRRLHPDGVPAGLRDVHRVARSTGSSRRACRCGCT